MYVVLTVIFLLVVLILLFVTSAHRETLTPSVTSQAASDCQSFLCGPDPVRVAGNGIDKNAQRTQRGRCTQGNPLFRLGILLRREKKGGHGSRETTTRFD